MNCITIGNRRNWKALLVGLIAIIATSRAHLVTEISLPEQTLLGLTNRMIPIPLTPNITKVFSASTSVSGDLQYIAVRPAKVLLQAQEDGPKDTVLPAHTETILEELRTFHSSEYQDILVIGGQGEGCYILLFLMPATVVVVKQTPRGFVIEDKYQLVQISQMNSETMQDYDATFYGIGASQNHKYNALKSRTNITAHSMTAKREGLLTISNSNYIFRAGIRGYQRYRIPQKQKPTNIEFLAFIDDDTFIAAEGNQGISVYSLPAEGQQSLQLVSRLTCKDLNLQYLSGGQQYGCKITDLSLGDQQNILHLLDAHSGLIAYQYTLKQKQFSMQKKQYITKVNDCQSFDYIQSPKTLFVLVCALKSPPYILEVTPAENNEYVQSAPKYHPCTFRDLILGADFYLAFDRYSVDVFWTDGPQENSYVREEVNFAGLAAFALKRETTKQRNTRMKSRNGEIVPNDPFSTTQDNEQTDVVSMYVVQENVLTKYRLTVFPGGVYVYSPYPLRKELTITVPALCTPSSPTLAYAYTKTQPQLQECVYRKKVKLVIQNEPATDQRRRQKVSMSLGIVVVLLVVLTILVWICVKKYNGLEEHARRLLDRHRRQAYNDNKFTL